MKTINELAKDVYENAKSKGWYDNGGGDNIGERIALIHSELSEALEADRKGRVGMLKSFESALGYAKLTFDDFEKGNQNCDWIKNRFETTIKDTFEDEIVDVILRCFDMSAHLGFDLEKHLELKMRYNTLRPQMHGGKKY